MIELSTRAVCAHASVKPQIRAMDLGKSGMLACLLNDELRGQVVAIFVGRVIDSFVIVFVIISFVIASTLRLSSLTFETTKEAPSSIQEMKC